MAKITASITPQKLKFSGLTPTIFDSSVLVYTHLIPTSSHVSQKNSHVFLLSDFSFQQCLFTIVYNIIILYSSNNVTCNLEKVFNAQYLFLSCT